MKEKDYNIDDERILMEFEEVWGKVTEDLVNKGWNSKKIYDCIASFHVSLIGFNIDVGNLNTKGATNLIATFVDKVKKNIIRREKAKQGL